MASIDQNTNSISLFNILEQITVFTDQVDAISLPIELEIVSGWIRKNVDEPTQGKMRVFFFDPLDNHKNIAELGIDLRKAIFYRTRVASKILAVKGPGRYKFVVELQQESSSSWEIVATLPFIVTYQPRPEKAED
jgi:hypothetical protein